MDGGHVAVASPLSELEPQAVTVDAWVMRASSPGTYRYIVAKGANACEAASLYVGSRI